MGSGGKFEVGHKHNIKIDIKLTALLKFPLLTYSAVFEKVVGFLIAKRTRLM